MCKLGATDMDLACEFGVGYSYHTQKVFCYEGSIVRADIVEHVPPDVSAVRLWL